MGFIRYGARRVCALLAAGWMTVIALPASASTFGPATRAVGDGATSFGAVIKTDYHPENMFIQGYWSNGTGAGGTSGGTASLGQKDVGETGGTVNAGLSANQQTVGGAVLTTATNVQMHYGGTNAVAQYGDGATTDANNIGAVVARGAVSNATDSYYGSIATNSAISDAYGSVVAQVTGDVAAGESAALAMSELVPYVGVVLMLISIFDLFGSGITYSWSGSCTARTGAPCSGYYDNEGYQHVGYGIYVPKSALAEVQNDVNMSSLGDSIQSNIADKNTDPNAIYDGAGKKIVGNYGLYTDQGSGLLLGFHPQAGSVLISNVVQQIPENSGWKQETVYQGVNNVPLNMYSYAPAHAWDGTGS